MSPVTRHKVLEDGRPAGQGSTSQVRLPFISYSSLDVLRAFPLDRVELDASFVAGTANKRSPS